MFASVLGIDLTRVIIDGAVFAALYWAYYSYINPAPGGVGVIDSLIAGAEASIAQVISQVIVKHIPFVPESLDSLRDQAGVDLAAAAILGAYTAYMVGGNMLVDFSTAFLMSIAANIVGNYVEDMFYHESIVGSVEAAAYSRRKADRADDSEKKAQVAEIEGSVILAESIRANGGDDMVLA